MFWTPKLVCANKLFLPNWEILIPQIINVLTVVINNNFSSVGIKSKRKQRKTVKNRNSVINRIYGWIWKL